MQIIKLKTDGFIAEYTTGSHIIIKPLDDSIKNVVKLTIYKAGKYRLPNSNELNKFPIMTLKLDKTIWVSPNLLKGLYTASMEGIAILNKEGGQPIDPNKIGMLKESIKNNQVGIEQKNRIIPQENLSFGSIYINKLKESMFYFGNCFVYKLDSNFMTYVKQSKQFPSNYFIYADSQILKYIKGSNTQILNYPRATLKVTCVNVTPYDIVESNIIKAYRTEKKFVEKYTVDIIPSDTNILEIIMGETKYLFVRKLYEDMQLPSKIKLNSLMENVIDKIYNSLYG